MICVISFEAKFLTFFVYGNHLNNICFALLIFEIVILNIHINS